MKILLLQNSIYIPVYGGANKSNRILLEGFSARNHECRIIAPASVGMQNGETHTQFLHELRIRGITVHASLDGVEVIRHKGVEVHAVTWNSRFNPHVVQQIKEFEPTCVLVCAEDPGQILLQIALKTSTAPVVYLARTTSRLPFGPVSSIASSVGTDMLRQTTGIIAVSHYVKNYIQQWGGRDAAVLPISLLGSGPFPDFGNFNAGYVMIINPCAQKGGSIFLELARKLPDVQFGAVPTWGTTDTDLAALKLLPNVRIFEPADDIDEIYSRCRVLLVPSIWAEAKGRVIMEAMLRGIPVLASDVGGIPEAKLGIEYLLPVNPIVQHEEQRIGEQISLVPVVPEQDITPWLEALKELLSSKTRYDQIAKTSREAALTYVENNGIELVEEYLRNLIQSFEPRAQAVLTIKQGHPAGKVSKSISHLSPKQREILIRQLRKKGMK